MPRTIRVTIEDVGSGESFEMVGDIYVIAMRPKAQNIDPGDYTSWALLAGKLFHVASQTIKQDHFCCPLQRNVFWSERMEKIRLRRKLTEDEYDRLVTKCQGMTPAENAESAKRCKDGCKVTVC